MVEAKIAKTSECEITYREIGDGPALLLIQGGGAGATGWSNFGSLVDDLKNDFRVIIPDAPGFGDSRIVNDGGQDFQILAAKAFAELLTGFGIDKAHVFGNSMGGGVALRMAMAYPEKVDRLALMGPYLRGFERNFMSPAPVGDMLHYALVDDPSFENFRPFVRSLAFAPDEIEGIEELIKVRYEAFIKPENKEAFKRIGKWVPDGDPRSAFQKVAEITHQTLIFWGREDKHCNLEVAFQFLDALRNSELVVFRNTGHWVQIERRKEFIGYIKTFLSR